MVSSALVPLNKGKGNKAVLPSGVLPSEKTIDNYIYGKDDVMLRAINEAFKQ